VVASTDKGQRGKESGQRWWRSSGLDTRRRDIDRRTERVRGAPTAAVWKEDQTKGESEAEPGRDTNTNTDAENHMDTDSSDNIIADTHQTMGDSPTMKLKETG
jgi:hypothetical protein